MTQFEFTSVFASIIMGLGLAHLFTGAIQQVYRRQINYAQSCCALLALLIIVLNWWALFAWKDEPAWSLLQFLILALWSLSMFVLCVAVYPPGDLGKENFAKHQRVVALSFAVMVLLDIAQTAAHGSLLQPPSYLPIVSHFVVVGLAAAAIRNTLAFSARSASRYTGSASPYTFGPLRPGMRPSQT